MIDVTLTYYTGSIASLYSSLNTNRTTLRSLQLDQGTNMIVPYVIKNREFNKFVEVIDTEFSELITTSGPTTAELQLIIDDLNARLDAAETQVTTLESDLTTANETIDLLASAADTTELWRPARLYPRIVGLNFEVFNFYDIDWAPLASYVKEFFGPEMNQVELDSLTIYETSLTQGTSTTTGGIASVIDRLRNVTTVTTVTAAEIDALVLSQIPSNYRNALIDITNDRSSFNIPQSVPNTFSFIIGNGTNSASNYNDFKLYCKKIVSRAQSRISTGSQIQPFDILFDPALTTPIYFSRQYALLYNQPPI